MAQSIHSSSKRSTIAVDASLLDASRHDAVDDLSALESMYGAPQQTSIDKVTSQLTPLMIDFLQASPMYLLATANAEGQCDVSPRGDPSGAVVVVDEATLILPDRRGNKRVDSLRNLAENDRVGLLFLVPGINDTLRVNGRATLSRHQPLLDTMPMQGKVPNLAVIVDIEEAYMHCPRAFTRSGLWDVDTWPGKDTVPSMSAILHQQFNEPRLLEDFARERDEREPLTRY